VAAAGAARCLSSFLLLILLLLACSSGCGLLSVPGAVQQPPSGALVVSFIDVGQGDGVLVQSGGENYLLDADKAQVGPRVVDFFRSHGVGSLDGIVVSTLPSKLN
jgi:competence protein ComEC